MNIGFDLRPLQTAHKYRGIGRHCYNLINALRRCSDGVGFSFLAYDNLGDGGDLPLIPNNGIALRPNPGNYNRYRYIADDLLKTDRVIRSLNVNLFHYQMQNSPLKTSVPVVVTVHDCIVGWLGRRGTTAKERLLFRLQGYAVRAADAVIAVSAHSKNDIVRYMGVDPDKVYIAYNGIDAGYKPVLDTVKIRERYNLPDGFLLYCGAVDYRKNPRGLLRIYRRYSQMTPDPLPLVFVGKREYFREIRQYWRSVSMGLSKGSIAFTGYVDDDDMPALYSAARLLLFPSLYEGFGLPLIESMACGTPVIAYDNSSVSEMVGRWGVLVENNNENEFTRRILDLLEDSALYQRYKALGLERASHFDWDETARKTLAVYRKIA